MKNAICKLDNRIQFFKLEEEYDASGGIIKTHSPYFSSWARVKPLVLRNGETWQSGALDYINQYKVWIRIGIDIDTAMQIQWKGQTFEIKTPPVFTEDKKFQIFIMQNIGEGK